MSADSEFKLGDNVELVDDDSLAYLKAARRQYNHTGVVVELTNNNGDLTIERITKPMIGERWFAPADSLRLTEPAS
jgi:ribosomal protein L21E